MSKLSVSKQLMQKEFFSFADRCHSLSCEKDFLIQIYPKLHKLLPHEAFACGIISLPSFHIEHRINVSYPESYLRQIVSPDNCLCSPIARAWHHLREPLYVDYRHLPRHFDPTWRNAFDSHGFQTVLVHGLIDIRNQAASFFSFAGVGAWDKYRESCIKLIVPYLHIALTNIFCPAVSPDIQLSRRESEVLKWICMGKSNGEIGQILGISPWTVKVYVRKIMEKFGVSRREHAVAKALMRGHTNSVDCPDDYQKIKHL